MVLHILTRAVVSPSVLFTFCIATLRMETVVQMNILQTVVVFMVYLKIPLLLQQPPRSVKENLGVFNGEKCKNLAYQLRTWEVLTTIPVCSFSFHYKSWYRKSAFTTSCKSLCRLAGNRMSKVRLCRLVSSHGNGEQCTALCCVHIALLTLWDCLNVLELLKCLPVIFTWNAWQWWGRDPLVTLGNQPQSPW